MREKISKIYKLLNYLEKSLVSYGAEKKDVQNVLLAVEELFLLYKEKVNDDIDINAEVYRGTRIFSVKIDIGGNSFSPALLQKESGIKIFDNIISSSKFKVAYSYTNNTNHVEIIIKKFFNFIENFLFAFKLIDNKKTIVAAFVAHIFGCIANLLLPIITGQLIVAYTEKIFIQILVTAIALLFGKLIYNIFFRIANIQYTKSTYFSQNSIRKELINKLFTIKNDVYEKNGTGTFIQRVTKDLEMISGGVADALDMFSQSMYFIGVFFAIAVLDIWMFVAEVVIFGILIILERKRAYRLDIDTRKTMQSDDLLSSSVIDCVNGIFELKVLNGGLQFSKKIALLSNNNVKDCHMANYNTQRWIIFNSCVMAILSFGIIVLLGVSVEKEIITVPIAVVLFNYHINIDLPSIALIQRIIDFVKRFNLSSERVRNLLDGSEFAREITGKIKKENLYGDIEFNNVTFAYNHDDFKTEDNNIFLNLNLHINKGEMVAFVGESGCGKTTILKLISRQLTCYSGEITIDGYPLQELDTETLYDNLSVVSQTPYIFNCSIKENLLIAKPDATEKEIKLVLEKVNMLEFIENCENGLDTQLCEKGARFSGGQKQRLAIARALLKNPNILLLDEATSAVDNITQDGIISAINNIRKDHTVVVVAHRLSTVKYADRILVIGNKGIIAEGTHDELVETSEVYRRLYLSKNNQ